jgi:uncharacterized protein
MADRTEIEFDPVKSQSNLEKHGVSLADVADFEWETAQIDEDVRFVYAERRFRATGWLGERLHVLIFCKLGEATRAISFRAANEREATSYANSD